MPGVSCATVLSLRSKKDMAISPFQKEFANCHHGDLCFDEANFVSHVCQLSPLAL